MSHSLSIKHITGHPEVQTNAQSPRKRRCSIEQYVEGHTPDGTSYILHKIRNNTTTVVSQFELKLAEDNQQPMPEAMNTRFGEVLVPPPCNTKRIEQQQIQDTEPKNLFGQFVFQLPPLGLRKNIDDHSPPSQIYLGSQSYISKIIDKNFSGIVEGKLGESSSLLPSFPQISSNAMDSAVRNKRLTIETEGQSYLTQKKDREGLGYFEILERDYGIRLPGTPPKNEDTKQKIQVPDIIKFNKSQSQSDKFCDRNSIQSPFFGRQVVSEMKVHPLQHKELRRASMSSESKVQCKIQLQSAPHPQGQDTAQIFKDFMPVTFKAQDLVQKGTSQLVLDKASEFQSNPYPDLNVLSAQEKQSQELPGCPSESLDKSDNFEGFINQIPSGIPWVYFDKHEAAEHQFAKHKPYIIQDLIKLQRKFSQLKGEAELVYTQYSQSKQQYYLSAGAYLLRRRQFQQRCRSISFLQSHKHHLKRHLQSIELHSRFLLANIAEQQKKLDAAKGLNQKINKISSRIQALKESKSEYRPSHISKAMAFDSYINIRNNIRT